MCTKVVEYNETDLKHPQKVLTMSQANAKSNNEQLKPQQEARCKLQIATACRGLRVLPQEALLWPISAPSKHNPLDA